jgi:Fe-S-cluster containining protein
MCGECCRFYAVEILPSDIHRLCELLQISPADFVARHTVPPKFGWNRDNRVLLKVPTPLYTKVLRELQVHGQDTPPLEGAQGLQCTFLERRQDGFFYCGVHSHKPKVCADYKATNPLCRKTNQVPNEGRQAHSVQWVYLSSDGLRLQTLRGAAAQVEPLFVARGYWPEVEEASLALERAAVASLS